MADTADHPTDLDTLLKEERAKNERLEEGIAYLRGIEQRNNELIDRLLARAEAAEASSLTARRDGERDGLLRAKQIALAELRDWQAKDIEEGEAAADQIVHEINGALRTLASTVPGGEEPRGFVETHGYGSDPVKLRRLLEGRDQFIVDRGLWGDFVDTLPPPEMKE